MKQVLRFNITNIRCDDFKRAGDFLLEKDVECYIESKGGKIHLVFPILEVLE